MKYKDIPNYEGKYSISKKGDVYSYKNKRNLIHNISKTNGIHNVKLVDFNGKIKTFSIIKLLALTYLHNPNPKLYKYAINISGNHKDTTIDNVMWGTSSLSVRRKYKRFPSLKEELKCKAKPINTRKMTNELEKEMIIMRKLGYSTKQLSEIFPINKSQIYNILKKHNIE
jgi:hypothetical protein